MVDKLTPVSRSRLGFRLGSLPPEDMIRLNRAMLVFLGMAASSRA
jgi:mRNA interferase MazF